jgi:APA family basic amino acid/polyamine antiporter
VRAGGTTQNLLMVLKIAAIAVLVVAGFALGEGTARHGALLDRPLSPSLFLAVGAAMTPVMFAFGGWQTASFVSGEMKEPRRDLARGLILGVGGVVTIYLAVNLVSLHVLGAGGLAATTTPASSVMRAVLGERGARLIALGIALSTLGFLSQSMLTAPRVYFAMAADGLFFRSVAKIHPRTHVPVLAIVLQGAFATLIAWSGSYERILGYVVSADFVWFGLTGLALFVFRGRDTAASSPRFRTPLHPLTTALFVAACWTVVIATVVDAPRESLIGFAIIAAGLPVYWLWARGRQPDHQAMP